MAGDDVLADPIIAEDFVPTVRFYSWNPPAVSLGIHQSPDVIDGDLCHLHGWDIVRRPTGGRALLHNADLSYSVTLPGGSKSPGVLKYLYEAVSKAWIATFKALGLNAEMTFNEKKTAAQTKQLRDGLCLDSRVRGELAIRGRKIGAAAQRMYPETILQHGSIVLTGDVTAIAQVLPLDTNACLVAKVNLRKSAASVEELTGQRICTGDLIRAAVEPFSRFLDLQLTPSEWYEKELKEIEARLAFHDILRVNPFPSYESHA